MGHGHDHHHEEHTQDRKVLLTIIAILTGAVVLQLIGGHLSGSLGVISDAVHSGIDGFAYIAKLIIITLTMWAVVIRSDHAGHFLRWIVNVCPRMFQRSAEDMRHLGEIIGYALLGIGGMYLVVGGGKHLLFPETIDSPQAMLFGSIGLIANLIMLTILIATGGRERMRSIFLHAMSDMLHSLMVVSVHGAVLLFGEHLQIFDPALAFLLGWRMLTWFWTGIKHELSHQPLMLGGFILSYEEDKHQHPDNHDH